MIPGYGESQKQISRTLRIGRDAERDDPRLAPLVNSLTDEHIDWIASWLASEGFSQNDDKVEQ